MMKKKLLCVLLACMKKKLLCVLLACLLLLSIGCAAEKPQTTLRVAALKGPTGMGLAYLMQENSSEFPVELLDAPDVVTGKFINGEVDIAAVPVNLAAVLSNKTEGEAVMIAVETRTSSPVRILRDNKTLQHVSLRGLYPCGEGAGYAGGIVSAAIDGERCAECLASELFPTRPAE